MEGALIFRNRDEWRSWLKEHHGRENEVWLVLFKKRFGRKGVTLDEAVEEAICFGWIDGKLKRIDDEKHALRFSPRRDNSVWSKINRDRAERLIASGRMTPAGLAKIREAQRSGQWDRAYTNKTKERMPLDLKKALTEDKRAWDNFQGFANTYRNMYIGWVNDAKTDGTRRKRIRKVVSHSLQNKKYSFL